MGGENSRKKRIVKESRGFSRIININKRRLIKEILDINKIHQKTYPHKGGKKKRKR